MQSLKETLSGIVGSENVSDELGVRLTYSRDTGIEPPVTPGIVVRPRSTVQVSKVVQVANLTRTPIWLRGGATSTAGGGFPIIPGGILLDMTSMRRIVEINEDQMYVTVECGITWSALNAELEKRGYYGGYMGPESGLYSTVGGSTSCNSGGMGSCKYGPVGKNIVNLEVVLPTGDVIRTGSSSHPLGHRFARYVQGPDLTGLFIGDHGCFGVKCKATLPMRKKPAAFAYTSHLFSDVNNFVRAEIRTRKYNYIEHGYYFDPWGVEFAYPQVAKEHPRKYGGGLWLIKLAEDEESLAEKEAKTINKICEEEKAINLGVEPAKSSFAMGYDFYPVSAKVGQWQFLCSRIPVPLLPKLLEVVHNFADESKIRGLPGIAGVVVGVIDADEVSLMFCPTIWFDSSMAGTWNSVRNFFHAIAGKLYEAGATPYWILRLWAPHVMWKLGQSYELMRSIKRILDPNSILQPGMLMLPTGYSGPEYPEPGVLKV